MTSAVSIRPGAEKARRRMHKRRAQKIFACDNNNNNNNSASLDLERSRAASPAYHPPNPPVPRLARPAR